MWHRTNVTGCATSMGQDSGEMKRKNRLNHFFLTSGEAPPLLLIKSVKLRAKTELLKFEVFNR
jgi:hypothetical protein